MRQYHALLCGSRLHGYYHRTAACLRLTRGRSCRLGAGRWIRTRRSRRNPAVAGSGSSSTSENGFAVTGTGMASDTPRARRGTSARGGERLSTIGSQVSIHARRPRRPRSANAYPLPTHFPKNGSRVVEPLQPLTGRRWGALRGWPYLDGVHRSHDLRLPGASDHPSEVARGREGARRHTDSSRSAGVR